MVSCWAAAAARCLRDHGDGHVLIMGPARSGKGTGHVIPTLLGHAGAMLVFDPKHELAAITGRRRAAFGPVHVFDPTAAHSARFNPLLELRRDGHLIGDCQMAAHMLTHLGHGGRDDPFWDDAAAALLTAVLLHVCTSRRAQPGPGLAGGAGHQGRHAADFRPSRGAAHLRRARSPGKPGAQLDQRHLARPAGLSGRSDASRR